MATRRQPRQGLRLAGPARPLIGVEEHGTAGSAARGRRAAPRQCAAPAGLGRPRRPGRADPAAAGKGPPAAARSRKRIWATPLEALLVAERAALLSGSDDDFALVITIAYTGMRWAEAIGLEREHLRLSLINVEWQLHEVNGRFLRLPPKDDGCGSFRGT